MSQSQESVGTALQPPPHEDYEEHVPYDYGYDYDRDPYASPHPAPYGSPGAEETPEPLVPRQAAAARPFLATADGGRAAARRAARSRRTSERPEMLRRLLPQALVVAFLAGGTSAFVAYDKSVTLDVEGDPRTLHTFAGDVEELLEDEGVELGRHDVVSPGRTADLADGDEIDIRYGRPVRLTLDGHRHTVWTTARTVDGALRELGVRAEGARLSAPRSAPIGRTGTDLEVWTERGVTFLADSREHRVRTNAPTVEQALREAGLELRNDDTTSVPLDSFPRDGQTVTVMRITGSEQVREQRIPYETERRDDPGLQEGTEVVARHGKPGLRQITYRVRTVNGVRQKPRRLGSEVVRAPQTEVIKVGTKKLPDTVEGAEGLDWGALAQCESGGDPRSVDASGTYGGLYQFDSQTWQSLGGSGRPQDAPAAEQTMRAKKLYVSRGASPWPVCGRKLQR
ncbi:resuscitation-promoting factor [Streptomyces albiaxialis]|uniref:Resuscitation-promoting factor n=1 Tax=Streptomyces albiaxialis TaxID=329523 RepID=A0ABN2VEW3_9ACTN